MTVGKVDIKAALLTPRIAERPVEVPDVGTVTVRALTRAEVIDLREQGLKGAEFEQHMLAAALVDPELTVDEVATWQQVALAPDIDPVVATVLDLSGLGPGRAKEHYKELASDSDAEFRDGARQGSAHDGDASAG